MGTTYEYDGVIIGAGHNGLILEGYLARAGLRVVAVELGVELGGGLDSHEDERHPGFWHNIHSVFHRNLADLPWYRDLELERFGAEYIKPEVGVAMLLEDGRCLIWYRDVERTCASLARLSPRDAGTFHEVHRRFTPVVRQIIFPETYAPPIPWARKAELLARSAAGREYLAFSAKSPKAVIAELFEHEAIQAIVGFLTVMRGYELDAEGLGYFVPGMIAGGVNPQLCKGTSHRLAHHLHRMAVSYGGDILEAREALRILVEDGVARGVQLADGARVLARRFVASSLDPQTTFLQLVGPEHLDAGFARRVAGYEYSAVSPILSVNLSLREPPRYRAAVREPDVARSFMIIAGLECSADLDDLYDACRAGELPRRLFMNGACPTVHDPTQAPPGAHTAFMWPLVPYDLKDGGPARWDAIKEAVMERYLERWRQYAPNLAPPNVLHAFTNSPLDIERHVPNMRRGDWMVGALNTQQMYDRRPLPELARHRTPIDRLYLCGSCCHPGGNITGAPGYNAAGIIAADLGMDPWWHPHDIEALWETLR